jgi:uncharacterized protein (TIGR00661 family)
MSDQQRCKIFLSDEGYGHIVRQRAIVEELRRLSGPMDFTVQSQRHIKAVERIISDVKTIDKFNNITWQKQANGSPDVNGIKAQFKNYIEDSAAFVKEEVKDDKYDFILSDFVYEAFEIAQNLNIPSFGVSHFTWDWFFSKLYPPPLKTKVLDRFFALADKANRLYFPPFTPEEILVHYGEKAHSVPLIVRSEIEHKTRSSNGQFKVMIIDSGAGVLSKAVKKALQCVADLDDFVFFVSSKFKGDQANLNFIDQSELMVDYVNDMDLVIGRAGFNTISECIGLRTPMLLIGEAMNPEMNENILNLKKAHLGTFIGLDTFESDLHKFLPTFVETEYPFLKQAMQDHEIETNGAEIIARDILDRIS